MKDWIQKKRAKLKTPYGTGLLISFIGLACFSFFFYWLANTLIDPRDSLAPIVQIFIGVPVYLSIVLIYYLVCLYWQKRIKKTEILRGLIIGVPFFFLFALTVFCVVTNIKGVVNYIIEHY